MRTSIIQAVTLFISFIFASFIAIGQSSTDASLNIVVIDPGHGGKDWGASSAGTKEKDIVLAVGLKVGKMIKELYPDTKVVFTRETDIFIPLHERAKIANKNKADLFISIHTNAVGVKTVSGAETFVLGNHRSEDNLEIAKKENSVILLEEDYNTTYEGFDPNSSESYIMFESIQGEYLEQSLQFASFVQNNFKVGASRIDRGVRQAGFLVLRETAMPAVLVELGFISNEKERLYLESAGGKETMSDAILKAFSNYKNVVEQKNSLNKYKTLWPADTIKSNEILTGNNPIAQTGKGKDSIVITQEGQASPFDSQTNRNIKDTARNHTNERPEQVHTSSVVTDSLKKIPTPEKDSVIKSLIPTNSAAGLSPLTEIWFSVQVTTSTKPVNLLPENFKGEKNITSQKINGVHKYFSGRYSAYSQALDEKNRLKSKFQDAFIVAFMGDKPIPVKEAIEKTSK